MRILERQLAIIYRGKNCFAQRLKQGPANGPQYAVLSLLEH